MSAKAIGRCVGLADRHEIHDLVVVVGEPAFFAVGGYGDGNWVGQGNFYRINTYQTSSYEVTTAAQYISGKIGAWPDLFAYPYGEASSYIQNTYFPSYGSEHQTFAAFCTDQTSRATTYVSRASPRYCLGRFTYGYAWPSNSYNPWASDLATILQGAAQ